MKKEDSIVWCISGNIGSGKETIAKIICDSLGLAFLEEPWRESLCLPLFYQDKTFWGGYTQLEMLFRRFKQHSQAQESGYFNRCIMERCVLDDRFVFAKTLYESSLMPEAVWSLYQEWADKFFGMLRRPSLFIYIRSTPELCYEMVHKKRGRIIEVQGGDGVSLEYLRSLHDRQESWLAGPKEPVTGSPIFVVDRNKIDPEHNSEDRKSLVQSIKMLEDFVPVTLG